MNGLFLWVMMTFCKRFSKKVSKFLKKNNDLCYVLKSHYLLHEDSYKEPFKYSKKHVFLNHQNRHSLNFLAQRLQADL